MNNILIKENIEEFITNNPSWVIVIYGPTWCWKTALSLEVAKLIRSEVISVDARQVYRGLDIWTGKITEQERWDIPHHMLDVVDITEPFSVVDFRKMVEELEIWKKMKNQLWIDIKERVYTSGNLPPYPPLKGNSKPQTKHWELSTENRAFPILCGGTWLYIDSLIYERDYMGEKPDTTRRDELEAYRMEHGNEALWNMLHDIDPTYADMLHVNNYTYIIRGIEVFEKTGRSKLEAIHGQKLLYPTLFITPYIDSTENRTTLYERINLRVQKMFDDWLIEEVWYNIGALFWGNLHEASSCPGLVTIGYREVIQYLKWAISLNECISLVQQHNRNYAKRQITWNKKYDCFNY